MPLQYKQGNIALLSAQFVTVTGMPVDVPDATVQVIGTGGTVFMGPQLMTGPVVTGFYYTDWIVPNSLPTGTYTVRYSGTVLGVPSAITDTVTIIPAASPAPGISSRQLELIAYLSVYLRCAQCIPVNLELPRRNKSLDRYQLSWPRWNLSNPIVMFNREPIETGYTINYDTGTILFDSPRHDSDEILCSYNFRWFSETDLLRFLSDALNQINLEAPGTTFTLDTVPDQYIGVLMLGGSKNAIKQMMFCLMFQQPQKVFGENAKDLISQLDALKQNNEKEFERDKKQIKRAVYPKIGVNVTPEYTLPGGRCLSPEASSLYKVNNDNEIQLTIEKAFELFEEGKQLEVLSQSDVSKKLVFAKVAKIWRSGKKKIWKVETEGGKNIRSSGEHLYYVNGKYIPLFEANVGDELVCLSNDGNAISDRILRVVKTDDEIEMFDIEVPETENLFANGIKCHNSRWFRYLYTSSMG